MDDQQQNVLGGSPCGLVRVGWLDAQQVGAQGDLAGQIKALTGTLLECGGELLWSEGLVVSGWVQGQELPGGQRIQDLLVGRLCGLREERAQALVTVQHIGSASARAAV